MGACLSDEDLGALMRGSVSAERRDRCHRHLETCEACRTRLAERQLEANDSAEAVSGSPVAVEETADRDPEDGFAPGTRLGDFRIEERLGAGGMGVVYRVRQLSLNRQVALKVIWPGLGMASNALKRFHREARAAARLHHTNIVAVYAEGEDQGVCHYAMELIEGQSLAQIIAGLRSSKPPEEPAADKSVAGGEVESSPTEAAATTGPLSGSALGSSGSDRGHFDVVAKLITDAADALDYAHGQGVIHRDIKPSNLMLDREGRLKLMDFGLARVLEEPGMTLSGEFLGTPRYMSPEQIAVGRMKIDHRTDIYSLGATLYELLTLRPPFSGEHRDEVIAQIMTKEPPRLRRADRNIPVDLKTICLKAIEKDPDRRYQTAGAFAEDLRRYVNRYAISAKRIGPLGRLAKFARRHKLPVAAAAAVLIMASIAGTLLWKWRTAEKVARGQRQQRQELQRQVEAERYLWEAQRLHAGGRYNDALSKIELALQRKPTLLEARLLHARLLVEMDRGAEAAAALDRLANENPDEGAIHYLLARLYRDADPRKADHHRRLAEKLLPETAYACHLRAIAAGTLKETVHWLSEGLELQPRHYPSIRARALTYYALKDYAKMETDAGSLILLRPEAALGYALRAVARRESGRLEDALRDHDRAIQLAADDPELYAQRRETHLRKADFERALADARRCVELRPEEPTYRYYVFVELVSLGRYEAAKEEYEKIIADGHQAEQRFFTWASEYVFDALGAGHQVSLPDETFGGYMLVGMHRTIDYYHRLDAKARRAVAEGFVASWSPDASELAYGRGRPGSSGIEILHLESGKTRLLTVPGKDPVWSPDGRHIAFVREPQTRQIAGLDSRREIAPASDYMHREEIWIVTPSGEGARRLARGGFPSWSGDSKRVYFHSRHDKAINRIAVDDPAAVPTRIMASPSSYPVVSPDEQYVAYARGSALLVDELPSGKGLARWTAPGMVLGMLLRWSPDGQELSMGGYNESSLGLWIYDLKTQEALQIFDGPTTAGVWSPDRSRFAFDVRVPIWEIWVADLDPKVPTTQALGPAQTVRQHLQGLADRCERYIQAEPDNPRGYMARSMPYWYLEEYEKAAADYRRAAELDPTLLGPMPAAGPSLFVAAIPDRPPPGYSTFLLSGGPDSDTPLLVDDDLELYVDGTLVFRDSDKKMTLFRRNTWGGQPISFLAKSSSKIRVRVLDYGDRAAVGHVYLHHPKLGSRQLLTGRSQETPIAPPSRTADAENNVDVQNQAPPAQELFVLLDEPFDLAEVFAVATD